MAKLDTQEVLNTLQSVVACAEEIAHSKRPRQTTIGEDRISVRFQDIDALRVLVGRTIKISSSYLTVVNNRLMVPNDPAGRYTYLDFQQVMSGKYPAVAESALNGLTKIIIYKLYQAGGSWQIENSVLAPTVNKTDERLDITPNESITITRIEDIEQVQELGRTVCMLARQLTI